MCLSPENKVDHYFRYYYFESFGVRMYYHCTCHIEQNYIFLGAHNFYTLYATKFNFAMILTQINTFNFILELPLEFAPDWN